LNAIIEVYWYSNATSLTETQLRTFNLLIGNVQGHILVLDVVRKRLIKKSTSSKVSFQDFNVETMSLMTNPKLELLSHFPQARRDAGCDNHVRDTSEGELYMKVIRSLFNSTSKRHDSYLKEMLRKHQHLLYLKWMRRGMDHRLAKKERDVMACEEASCSSKRSFINLTLVQTDVFIFQTNASYKNQILLFSTDSNKYVREESIQELNIHPLLKLVCVIFSFCR